VAGLEILHFAADRFHLARAFETDARADAADAAMLMTQRDQQVGTVEARRAHADDDLVGFRLRLRQVADLDTVFTQDCGFHGMSPSGQARLVTLPVRAPQRPGIFARLA